MSSWDGLARNLFPSFLGKITENIFSREHPGGISEYKLIGCPQIIGRKTMTMEVFETEVNKSSYLSILELGTI